jgi:hypothetical protein
MMRTLPLLAGLLIFVSPAAAQESPLAQIPAKAPLVIGVRGVKRAMDRLVAMVKSAVPNHAKAFQTLVDDLLKKGLGGARQLQGLKDDGPIFLVLATLPKVDKLAQLNQASLGLIARVTDYKVFRDGLLTADERKSLAEDKTNGWEAAAFGSGQVFFIPRKDYAVVCWNREAAAAFAKKSQDQGLETTLAKPVARKLLDSDLGIYIDLAAVRKEYEPLVNAGKQAFQGLLDQGGEESDKLDKGLTEMIKGISGALLQLVDDSTYLFVACDFRPQGLAFHVSAGLADGSKTNEILKTLKPAPLAGLGALPAGFATYTAADFGPEPRKAFHPLVKNLLGAAGERGDQTSEKAVEDALVDLLDAGPRELYSGARIGAGRGGLQVWRYAEPAAGLTAQLRMFRALKEGAAYQLVPLKSKPVVKADAQPYRAGKLHRALLKWDVEKLADGLLGSEEKTALLKKLSGDGTTVWFGTVGQQTVQVSAKDWKAASESLDKYFKKQDAIGSDKAFLEARTNLPRETTLVTLIHVPQYGQYFAEVLYEAIKAQGGKGAKAPVAGASKAPDSYLGAAVTLQGGSASLDLWIPVAAAAEFARIVDPVIKQLGEK